jgi:epsilon-lactone hydrolase
MACDLDGRRHMGRMPSIRTRILVRFLRWRVKKPIKDPVDLAAVRAELGRPYRGRIPRDIQIKPFRGPVPGEWVVSDQAAADAPVMLYLHGGGFFACSPATHRAVTIAFARSGRLRLFVPDYRLAPEHRFPAALDDAIACCDRIVVETGRPIAAIGGDSAGGNLVLATLLRLRDTGRALPAAGVAFSAITDLAATGGSIIKNDRRDALFFGASMARLAGVYLPPGHDPRDPLASPLYADLAGLPPLLLHVGADEVLRDDSVRFAARAKAAQVDVTLRLWPVVPHAWQFMAGLLPEGRQSLREAIGFVVQAIEESSSRSREVSTV